MTTCVKEQIRQACTSWEGHINRGSVEACCRLLKVLNGTEVNPWEVLDLHQKRQKEQKEALKNPSFTVSWQLYKESSTPEQLEAAYRDLNEGLGKAVRALLSDKTLRVENLVKEHLGPVFAKWRDLGAQDTEPRSFARDILYRIQEDSLHTG